ncbi:hypothetical protein Tco_0312507, partial [Tanacetum coccineum]
YLFLLAGFPMIVKTTVMDVSYGFILNILQGRNELLEKIIWCVVYSGGVPELDPKVSFYPFV